MATKGGVIAVVLLLLVLGLVGYFFYSNFIFFSGYCESHNYMRFSGIELALVQGNSSQFVWYAGCCNDSYDDYSSITSSCVHYALPIKG